MSGHWMGQSRERIEPPRERDTFRNLPEDKRARIEEVLVREFSEQGFRDASLNSIVRRAGIAKGSLYQYFADKEAMFLFVFDRFTEAVKEAVRKARQGAGGDFWSRLRELLRAGVEFVDSHREYYRLYLRILFEKDVPRRAELLGRVRMFSADLLGAMVAEGIRRGELRPEVLPGTAVFVLDCVCERFLQGYARAYLDPGLGLAGLDAMALGREIDHIIEALRTGFASPAREDACTV